MTQLSDIVAGPVERLATGFAFTEGPLWHPDGYWLFVDTHPNRVHKLVPGGEPEIYREETNRTNGLTFDMQGRLLMCEGLGRRVSRREADGTVATLVDSFEGMRLNRPNDIVCRSDGSIYFTDPQGLIDESLREIGASMLFRLRPDGTLESLLRDIPSINGLAFSPDERTFYVINTREPKLIEAFDADAAGDLSNRRTFIDMSADPADGNPDGMKVDVGGHVYCSGPAGLWVMEPDGTHIGMVPIPELATNCAFGGADYSTMLVTARTSVYAVPLRTRGIVPPGAAQAQAH
jgi:gluconolactonase